MRILIIAESVGKTAPGKVFECIIDELSKNHDVTLACVKNFSEKLNDTIRVLLYDHPFRATGKIKFRLNKLSAYILGISWRAFRLRQVARQVLSNLQSSQFDGIITLCSATETAPMAIADDFVKDKKTPIYCYLVDAWPTPKWWSRGYEWKGCARYIKKFTRKVKTFASVNSQMLEYQKQYISPLIPNFDVIYPYAGQPKQDFPTECGTSPIILFTGHLYQARTPQYVLEAFAEFVKEFPDAKLIFVGYADSKLSQFPQYYPSPNIEVHHFVDDLSLFYEKSTVLLDIDAAVDGDVFLSSKLTNYLQINRPIISVTGEDSPARTLCKGIDSIKICHHDKDEILQALRETMNYCSDFSDRQEIIEKFNLEKVAKRISQSLEM